MSYSEEVKQLAYKMDEECWVSYSGKSADFKRAMDKRRTFSFESAKRYLEDKGLMRAIHSAEEVFERAFVDIIGINPPLMRFEKYDKEAVPPKGYKLRGKVLKVGDELRCTLMGNTPVVVKGIKDMYLVVETLGGYLTGYHTWTDVQDEFSWPKEAKSEQEELRHYYDTVITDMCKGTTVMPWECVRYARGRLQVSTVDRPLFFRSKEEYEFALTVHHNRPVWVGSVLYVGDGQADCGAAWTVQGITGKGHLRVAPQGQQCGEGVVTQWRNWAVWEKPVKQKAPTRVYVGRPACIFVNVPEQITGKGTARLVLDFGSNKDADEFYEVFKNLIGEKKA